MDEPSSSSSLLFAVAKELDSLQRSAERVDGHHFPAACLKFLLGLEGNRHCMDCQAPNPEWASVSYGCLICLRCCGRHRSYGVRTSFVRSIRLDAWDHEQVLAMLEGGNHQLQGFFRRHGMARDDPIWTKRYQTKAAQFYRTNLRLHVQNVSRAGRYLGRDASRRASSCADTAGASRNRLSVYCAPAERSSVDTRLHAANAQWPCSVGCP